MRAIPGLCMPYAGYIRGMKNAAPSPDSPATAQAQTCPDGVAKALQLRQAAQVSQAHFDVLAAGLGYLDASDAALVRQAWQYADTAHHDQWRSSGDPYITHPIAVAAICAQWRLDAPALMAALLHDAMEDCGVTRAELELRFGETVAALVDGLTKLDKLQFTTREEGQAESFRKMLLAMSRDVRVILIKLADRTHNMRTMGDMPRSKWGRISRETLEIYAPIAHRLGLNRVYQELQDLAFAHLHPWRHSTLQKALARARERRRSQVQRLVDDITAAFNHRHLPLRLLPRERTLYSLYQKMRQRRASFAQVTDVRGFYLIVPTPTDCYTALGVLHQLYKPVPGKFKDYIAIAKNNGYQSLHTVLAGPAGTGIECLLRTEQMHAVAEAGIAVRWLEQVQGEGPSGQSSGGSAGAAANTRWLQSLLDIQNETRDAADFWDAVKGDLSPDAIYVFTPKNRVMPMPQGATVVDFAYAVHSRIGHRTTAALVNGQPVPLRTTLRSGDVVEIITSDTAEPDAVWLGFVKTGRARSAIRSHLKTLAQQASVALGEKLLLQALREEGIAQVPAQDEAHQALWQQTLQRTGSESCSALLADIGMGRQAASLVARHIAAHQAAQGQRPDALLLTQGRFAQEGMRQGSVTLDGYDRALVAYAPCCRPVPGDAIVSYLLPGQGLEVHRSECPAAQRLHTRQGERFIAVEWGEESHCHLYECVLSVTLHNARGALAHIAQELAQADVDIRRMDMDDELAQHTTTLHFTVSVHDAAHAHNALRRLRRLDVVLDAQRMMRTGAGAADGPARGPAKNP